MLSTLSTGQNLHSKHFLFFWFQILNSHTHPFDYTPLRRRVLVILVEHHRQCYHYKIKNIHLIAITLPTSQSATGGVAPSPFPLHSQSITCLLSSAPEGSLNISSQQYQRTEHSLFFPKDRQDTGFALVSTGLVAKVKAPGNIFSTNKLRVRSLWQSCS